MSRPMIQSANHLKDNFRPGLAWVWAMKINEPKLFGAGAVPSPFFSSSCALTKSATQSACSFGGRPDKLF